MTDNFDKLLQEFDAKTAKFYAKRKAADKLLLYIESEVETRKLQINQNKPKINHK